MRINKTMTIAFVVLLGAYTNVYARDNYYVETDPFAFAFGGYSLHLGRDFGEVRTQVGVFSANYPNFMKNNTNFAVKMQGYGAKFDYYGQKSAGWFIGVSMSSNRVKYTLSSSGDSITQNQLLGSVRAGYRFEFAKRFYVAPWLSLGQDLLTPRTVIINDQLYRKHNWVPFATVHLGAKF